MITESFPHCCGVRIISCFGGGHIGQTEDHTKQQVIAWVAKQLDAYKEYYAVVLAMPTSTQPNACAALEELGFYSHPKPELCYHKGFKGHNLIPYFISLREFDIKEFYSRYDPTKDDYVNKPNSGIDQAAQEERLSSRQAW